ncbi:hypothetical protein DFH09DRAFT_1287308 [Mycena vulgaris]|nr:hypothetical protein DFH09DRAFT_1287308 [Mycena vulgaris]
MPGVHLDQDLVPKCKEKRKILVYEHAPFSSMCLVISGAWIHLRTFRKWADFCPRPYVNREKTAHWSFMLQARISEMHTAQFPGRLLACHSVQLVNDPSLKTKRGDSPTTTAGLPTPARRTAPAVSGVSGRLGGMGWSVRWRVHTAGRAAVLAGVGEDGCRLAAVWDRAIVEAEEGGRFAGCQREFGLVGRWDNFGVEPRALLYSRGAGLAHPRGWRKPRMSRGIRGDPGRGLQRNDEASISRAEKNPWGKIAKHTQIGYETLDFRAGLLRTQVSNCSIALEMGPASSEDRKRRDWDPGVPGPRVEQKTSPTVQVRGENLQS